MSAEEGAWIVVASAEHVSTGQALGIVQACHGKVAPLRRMAAGDRVICYSPTTTFHGRDRLQAFTAIGTLREGAPYQVEMGPGFWPFRRDVDWWPSAHAPIRPILDRLSFTRGRTGWGWKFRFGAFAIESGDADVIAAAMGAHPPTG
ncbi:EVE domain-containing protein [Amorphus sp. 3PC139-8]|uniref:EVE domain-containing protein n=1 Tax=Amorphus sp. 3PC139-8 TaxID=2735676 RepID=UPI00345DE4E7